MTSPYRHEEETGAGQGEAPYGANDVAGTEIGRMAENETSDEVGRRYLMKVARKFPTLSIDVEVGAGCSIEDGCRDLIGLADFLGLLVTSKFNDVTMLAHPGGNPQWLEANWNDAIKSKNRHKFAVSYERRTAPPQEHSTLSPSLAEPLTTRVSAATPTEPSHD